MEIHDLIHGSAKVEAQDTEADPDQLFWGLNYVHKDIVYDVANDIELLKQIARSMADGDRNSDPLNWQLSDIMFDIAYAFQKSIRAGGSIHGVFLKTLTTQSQSVRYETISREQKAKGMMEKGGNMFGFGKPPQPRPSE